MRDIVAMEQELGQVPEWASAVGIGLLAPCGHYKFPEPLLQVISLIGSSNPAVIKDTLKHQCYTVERDRKKAAQDYALCLDAWLAGTSPEIPAAELSALAHRKINWPSVCEELWRVLGKRTEKKELLVERILIGLRHAIKATRWDDERAAEFGRDQYLGNFQRGTSDDPVFDLLSSPRVKRIEKKLGLIDSQWRSLVSVDLGFWWLCAPKAFRLLERDLWAVGKDSPVEEGEKVSGFLKCEDTYPNQDEAAKWYKSFCDALGTWWKDETPTGRVADEVRRRLGDRTPVKKWLVRLLLKKLKTYERTGGSIGALVNPIPNHKRGRGSIQTC